MGEKVNYLQWVMILYLLMMNHVTVLATKKPVKKEYLNTELWILRFP